MRYTAHELKGILATRHGQVEGVGENACLDFMIRVTPELLDAMLGGEFVYRDGRRMRFDGVDVGTDGFVEPILVTETPVL